MASSVLDRETVLPPQEEIAELQQLAAALVTAQAAYTGAVELVGPTGPRVRLPRSVVRLLARAVRELAQGNAVMVLPIQAELTTQQAANLLNISRPSLIKLLEQGALPYHCIGTHRRIRVQDLLAYEQRRRVEQRAALAAALHDAEELGIYDLMPEDFE